MGIFDKISERVGGFIDEVFLPEEARAQFERASQAIHNREYARALEILERCEQRFPDLARTHHLIGQCLFYQGRHELAQQRFERALGLREEPASHFYAGLVAEQLGQLRQAQQHFVRALTLEPHPPFEYDLHFGLGRAYLKQGRADKAIKELRKAMRLWPEQSDASLALARALLARGQPEEAHGVIEELGQRAEGAEAQLVRGKIEEALGHGQKAREAYARAVEAGLDDVDALLGAARTALAARAHREAHDYLLRALGGASTSERAPIFALLGQVNEAIDNHQKAREHYEAALALDADRLDAWLGKGRVALRREAIEEAQQAFRAALERGRARERAVEALRGLALCRLASGDVATARHLLEEALEQREDRAATLHALGRVALTAGDAAEAASWLRQALEAADEAQDDEPPEELQRDLARALEMLQPRWRLPERLEDPSDVAAVLGQLRDMLVSDPRLVDFLPATQKMLRDLDAPLSVAIVGEFNAGKSTLINAILGESVVPTGVLPTTAHTGVVQYGPRKAARIVYEDESQREVDFDEARRLMKSDVEDIDHLDYLYPHPELRSVNFWDTPGFNALVERHEKTATRALEQAEAILWVLDANQVLSQTEFERIESLPSGHERLLILINKIDRLGPPGQQRDEQIEELLDYVRENASDHMAGCFALSALEALRHRQSDDPREEPGEGFAAFEAFFDRTIVQRSGRIKLIEARRHLARLVITLQAFSSGLMARYRRIREQLVSLRTWLDDQASGPLEGLAGRQTAALEDRVDFLLEGVAREIEEALRPRSSWTGRMALSEEDRRFVLELVGERLSSLLDRSQEQVFLELGGLEEGIAARMSPVLGALSLGDARAINRRLDGLFAELRVMKMLLTERAYGRLEARAEGLIEAAGQPVLRDIEERQGEPRRAWKEELGRLIPELDPTLKQELERFTTEYLAAAQAFVDRVDRDIALLELEARHRYDLGDLVGLLQWEDAEAQGEVEEEEPPAPAEDTADEDGAEGEETMP